MFEKREITPLPHLPTPIPLQLGTEIQGARGLIRRGALIRIIILTSLIIGVERRVNSDFKIFRGTN